MPLNGQPLYRLLHIVKFFLVILTIGAVILFPYLPPKILHLYPENDTWWGAYTDAFAGGNTSFEYLNDSYSDIRCTIGTEGAFNLCGNNLIFADYAGISQERLLSDLAFSMQVSKSISRDLSTYKGLWIDAHYEGPANYVHLILQNHEPAMGLPDPERQFRQQLVGINTQEFSSPIYIRLQDLKVADWWSDKFKLERTESGTRLDYIRAVGFELKSQEPKSIHQLRIHKVYATGDRLDKEQFYLIIIIVWSILLLSEAILRIYNLYQLQRNTLKSLGVMASHNKELHEAANIDELTGLLNRRAINNFSHYGFANDSANNIAIFVMDIDHFKRFNDTHGHALGDDILRLVAKTLTNVSRDSDKLGRWGGEEFIVITPPTSAQNAIAHAEKLRTAVATTPLIMNNTHAERLSVTMSIGITLRRPNESFDTAFKRADQALYQAKNNGRNRCSLA